METVHWVPLTYVWKVKKPHKHKKTPNKTQKKNTKPLKPPRFCAKSEQFSPYLTELIS